MATNQPDRDRSTEGDDVVAPGAGSTSGERGRLADERGRVAAEREAVADGRERVADDRDRGADDRERLADERYSSHILDEHAAADGLRRDESLVRDAALQDRVRASAARHAAEA